MSNPASHNAPSEAQLVAMTAAATDRHLLLAKSGVREMPDVSPERRQILCELLDTMFGHGFNEGALYMAKRAEDIINGR